MSERPNRAERRGHSKPEEGFEPAPFIYSKDPWDERRFNRFNPFARSGHGQTSAWEAVAPFLLIAGALALLVLAVWLVRAIAG
jgi:hypothetical protein